jgi:hypothetical protein
MEWKKASQGQVEYLAEMMKGIPCEHRKMFGYPCYFINRNMFIGLFGDDIFIRLSPEDRAELSERAEIVPFEPMAGRPMKDYVMLPVELVEDREQLASIIAKSVEYTSTLPEKVKKPRKAGAKKATKRAAKKAKESD